MKCECGAECEYIGTDWICPKCKLDKEINKKKMSLKEISKIARIF